MNAPFALRKPGSGFTLIELVVLLGIMTLLAGLAFPGLARTRTRSLDLIDFNNNRRLMAAANMYAADHKDFLPGPGWGTIYPCWAHAADLPSTISAQFDSCKHGQLFPYVQSQNTFLCPADKPNALYYQRSVFITSYVWNGAVCGYGNIAPLGYKLFPFKPDSILQWEGDDKTLFSFNDCSAFPDEGVSGRHGFMTTVGLFSGNAARVPVKFWSTSNYAGPIGARGRTIPRGLLPNRLWCNPGTGDGL